MKTAMYHESALMKTDYVIIYIFQKHVFQQTLMLEVGRVELKFDTKPGARAVSHDEATMY